MNTFKDQLQQALQHERLPEHDQHRNALRKRVLQLHNELSMRSKSQSFNWKNLVWLGVPVTLTAAVLGVSIWQFNNPQAPLSPQQNTVISSLAPKAVLAASIENTFGQTDVGRYLHLRTSIYAENDIDKQDDIQIWKQGLSNRYDYVLLNNDGTPKKSSFISRLSEYNDTELVHECLYEYYDEFDCINVSDQPFLDDQLFPLNLEQAGTLPITIVSYEPYEYIEENHGVTIASAWLVFQTPIRLSAEAKGYVEHIDDVLIGQSVSYERLISNPEWIESFGGYVGREVSPNVFEYKIPLDLSLDVDEFGMLEENDSNVNIVQFYDGELYSDIFTVDYDAIRIERTNPEVLQEINVAQSAGRDRLISEWKNEDPIVNTEIGVATKDYQDFIDNGEILSVENISESKTNETLVNIHVRRNYTEEEYERIHGVGEYAEYVEIIFTLDVDTEEIVAVEYPVTPWRNYVSKSTIIEQRTYTNDGLISELQRSTWEVDMQNFAQSLQ